MEVSLVGAGNLLVVSGVEVGVVRGLFSSILGGLEWGLLVVCFGVCWVAEEEREG